MRRKSHLALPSCAKTRGVIEADTYNVVVLELDCEVSWSEETMA